MPIYCKMAALFVFVLLAGTATGQNTASVKAAQGISEPSHNAGGN